MSIKNHYLQVKKLIPDHVELVAVSKTHPVEKIKVIYDLGQTVFGENKVQELVEKQALLPSDIRWHLIGHLQTNKVKYIASFIDTIQSVDSAKLLAEISKQALKHKRNIKVLLQIKIAEEDSKYGLTYEQAQELLVQWQEGQYPNVNIQGLMGMATFTEDTEQIKAEFQTLKQYFDTLSRLHSLDVLSMGMSGDFPIAICCGATSVRVGSAIFGERNYL